MGPYRLVRRLGEGGMGEVWEAEQDRPIRRTVALKLIKPGLDTGHVVARFESERQALALMQHPNVARVIDAGSTEQGRPYFVMEYVPGTPITTYCDEKGLDNRERLELFTQVCEGIQHAHQKGIIHRDIKPSNVLVEQQNGAARPVVIDFGVAKAVGQRLTEQTLETQFGVLIGTPEYMSPEQADPSNADIDTRTDVYSLGVLLYELLVGARPFDSSRLREAGLIELLRIIQQEEPSKPSTRISTLGAKADEAARRRNADPRSLARELRGDLDWIAMKALSKDRSHRYGSPADLAADLRRHANHEPVEAGPPSVAYRVRKFVRRHALGVGLLVLGFALVLGIAARERIQAGVIASERDRASQEARTAEQVAGFMTGLFEVADPSEARGNTITAREILDEGAERIEQELSDDPLIQARMMRTIGTVYRNLGLIDPARGLLERALAIHEELIGQDAPDVATDWFEIGRLQFLEFEMQAMQESFERALEIRRRVLDEDHPDLARAIAEVGAAHLQNDSVDEALPLLEEALSIQQRVLEPDHPDLARTLYFRAVAHRQLGEMSEALSSSTRALSMMERHHGPDHIDTGQLRWLVAREYKYVWNFEEARRLTDTAVETLRKRLGDRHRDVADVYKQLGEIELAMGRPDDAVGHLDRALDVYDETVDGFHHYMLYALWSLARARILAGDLDGADEALRRGEEVMSEAVKDEIDVEPIMRPIHNGLLAELRFRQGDFDAAKHMLQTNMAAMLDGPWEEDSVGFRFYRARYYAMTGDTERALRDLRRAIQLGYESSDILYVPELDPLRGLEEFGRLVEQVRQSLWTPDYWREGVMCMKEYDDPVRARKYLDKGLELLETDPEVDPSVIAYHRAMAHAMMGERADALAALREAAGLGFDDERVLLDEELDSLRGDPEFEALADRVYPRPG